MNRQQELSHQFQKLSDRHHQLPEDRVVLSVDEDTTVCATLKSIAKLHGDEYNLVFANGGDRGKDDIPEVAVCEKAGIKMVFNVGGRKVESSTRINQCNGDE